MLDFYDRPPTLTLPSPSPHIPHIIFLARHELLFELAMIGLHRYECGSAEGKGGFYITYEPLRNQHTSTSSLLIE